MLKAVRLIAKHCVRKAHLEFVIILYFYICRLIGEFQDRNI